MKLKHSASACFSVGPDQTEKISKPEENAIAVKYDCHVHHLFLRGGICKDVDP